MNLVTWRPYANLARRSPARRISGLFIRHSRDAAGLQFTAGSDGVAEAVCTEEAGMFARAVIVAALFVVPAGPVLAGGPLPPALPQDVQDVQACLSSRTADLAATCIGVTAAACLKTADSQQRMTQCMIRERAVWDLFLNNDYPAVMETMRPAAREELRAIERQFVSGTERRCTFIRTAMGYSSYIQVVEIERCMMHATAAQWLWLRDFQMKPEKQL